jgi:hypothetical protein
MAINRTSPKKGKVVDIPGIPTVGTATAAIQSATVAFTAATLGGPATTYTALSNPGSITGTGSSSPVTVSGLTAGTAYTFTVRGNNATGSGEYSTASNSVTPTQVTLSFDSIATTTLSSDSSTITFSNIPQTYKHLQVRALTKTAYTNTGVGGSQYKILLNGDTSTNYSMHQFNGNGSSLSASGNGSTYYWGIAVWNNAGGFGGSLYVPMILQIADYTNTNKYTTMMLDEGFNANSTSTNTYIAKRTSVWQSTNAVTSITFDSSTPYADGIWAAGTTFALYGIRG